MVDIDAMPDPGPAAAADLRAAIDDSGRSFTELAQIINRKCGITWVDAPVIARWHAGSDHPLTIHAWVIFWLSGRLGVDEFATPPPT